MAQASRGSVTYELLKQARDCLKLGSFLVDPRYMANDPTAEERFKVRCRECWHLRHAFPDWVSDYIAKWRKIRGGT